jgi:hypothetical protein
VKYIYHASFFVLFAVLICLPNQAFVTGCLNIYVVKKCIYLTPFWAYYVAFLNQKGVVLHHLFTRGYLRIGPLQTGGFYDLFAILLPVEIVVINKVTMSY